MLILPDAPLEVTLARAEMLRTGINGLRLEHRGQSLGELSVSLGVAVFPRHGVTGEVLLRAADEALYRAKEGGRNRVEVASLGLLQRRGEAAKPMVTTPMVTAARTAA